MTRTLSDAIADEKSGKEIISELKEFVVKTGISEQEVAVLVSLRLQIHFYILALFLIVDTLHRIVIILGMAMRYEC